jgi:hypothetical protein
MHEKRTKRAYASKRYGSAATFEMTYLGTPEGNETFRRKMAQMSNQMRRQAAWKAQAALIEPDKEETLWLQWFGARDYTSFCGALQREVDDFALVNKDQLGMSKLMNKCVVASFCFSMQMYSNSLLGTRNTSPPMPTLRRMGSWSTWMS